jgi:hypothetical protein
VEPRAERDRQRQRRGDRQEPDERRARVDLLGARGVERPAAPDRLEEFDQRQVLRHRDDVEQHDEAEAHVRGDRERAGRLQRTARQGISRGGRGGASRNRDRRALGRLAVRRAGASGRDRRHRRRRPRRCVRRGQGRRLGRRRRRRRGTGARTRSGGPRNRHDHRPPALRAGEAVAVLHGRERVRGAALDAPEFGPQPVPSSPDADRRRATDGGILPVRRAARPTMRTTAASSTAGAPRATAPARAGWRTRCAR